MRKADAKNAVTDYVDEGATLEPRKKSIVFRELKRIARERGALTAEIVLAEGTREDSPIHDQFCWDDGEAARRFRLNQARAMIIAAKIVYRQKQARHEGAGRIHVRQYVSRGVSQGYVERAAILTDEEVKLNLVRTKFRAVLAAVHELTDVPQLDAYRVTVISATRSAAGELEIEL